MDFESYIAPLRWAAPRHFPDPTVTAYLVAVHSLAALLRVPDIDPSYAQCNLILHTVQLDFSSLFWSTQSKVLQLNIRLRETDHSEDFVGQVRHFLCAKCGTWVPDHQFELHLPLRQLIQFDDAPPALKHRVPDSSHHCSIAFQLENSRVETNHWFVHHLSKPDWPSVCHHCNCIIMHSVLPLHAQSSIYCRQAMGALAVNSGYLSLSRFCHYPGHPRTHLFYVGAWPTAALARLRLGEAYSRAMLFVSYFRALAFRALLKDFFKLDTPVVKCMLMFLAHSPELHSCQLSGLLDCLLDFILCNKTQTAKCFVCLFARSSRTRQSGDRFCLSLF